MISLMLGRTGGGKSYETVVYHVLPAIQEGRKVITNMPLNLERIHAVWPGTRGLIELREVSASNPRPFSHEKDYGDAWRCPRTNRGPLYVIDECHKALPKGQTLRTVEEWFAEHRHEGADVHLITQSHAKISRNVLDLVDVTYRVIKARAFGSNKRYLRKVVDGVRGAELSVQVRTYEPGYFRFYTSHTKSGRAVAEASARDMRPIWLSWPFIGVAVCAVVLVGLLVSGSATLNPFAAAKVQASEERLALPEGTRVWRDDLPHSGPVAVVSKVAAEPVQAEKVPELPRHPLERVQLHVAGFLGNDERSLYNLRASQNGQGVFSVNTRELVGMGYGVEPIGDCAVKLTYGEWSTIVICDAPRQSVSFAAR
jgi:zona occludens toxin